MRNILLLLTIFLLACQAESPQLEIMSFNIRYGTANDGDHIWANRKPILIDMLEQEQPDVIGMQEALAFQISELLQEFPYYSSVGVGRRNGKTDGEFANILYRSDILTVDTTSTFWFSDTPAEPGSMTWGNRFPRICTWARFSLQNGESFYIYNVHLDHESQISREKSVELLLDRITEQPTSHPVIVTGDFNAGEENPAILNMKKNPDIPFVDSYRMKNPTAENVGTFNSYKGSQTGDKIDYVFVEPDFQVLEAQIITFHQGDIYPSDHFPVTASVRLPRSKN